LAQCELIGTMLIGGRVSVQMRKRK